jgi:hypothetical protein
VIWQLTDDYRISVVPMNFILERLQDGGKNPKTGEFAKPRWVNVGYYSSLEAAISALPSDIAQHPEIETFAHLSEALRKLAGQLSRRVGGAP